MPTFTDHLNHQTLFKINEGYNTGIIIGPDKDILFA